MFKFSIEIHDADGNNIPLSNLAMAKKEYDYQKAVETYNAEVASLEYKYPNDGSRMGLKENKRINVILWGSSMPDYWIALKESKYFYPNDPDKNGVD